MKQIQDISKRSGVPEVDFTEGKGSVPVPLNPNFVGWLGQIAHPDSPAGGGGPGEFTQVRLEPGDKATVPAAGTRGPVQAIPLQGEIPSPPNPPPATNPRSLGTLLQENSALRDVAIDAEVVADGTWEKSGARTTVSKVPSKAPIPDIEDGKVKAIKGKFEWRGTIRIQTLYGSGVEACLLSCYGRGTTDTDVQNRDITLGFHENNHQQDYVSYLKHIDLPALPALKVDMTKDEYYGEIDRFKEELEGPKGYYNKMQADSEASTDEVGYPKKKGGCYDHAKYAASPGA